MHNRLSVRDESWQPTLTDSEVQNYIRDEVGEEGLAMAKYLADNPGVSGVDIVDKHPERKPSDVRKVLYRMMEAHVAEYAKDTDAKGWETFLWHLDLNEIKYILRRRWADELLHARKQLRFVQDHEYYTCPSRHRPVLFDDAIELSFHCPVCGEPMERLPTGDLRRDLEARIVELQTHL